MGFVAFIQRGHDLKMLGTPNSKCFIKETGLSPLLEGWEGVGLTNSHQEAVPKLWSHH